MGAGESVAGNRGQRRWRPGEDYLSLSRNCLEHRYLWGIWFYKQQCIITIYELTSSSVLTSLVSDGDSG